MEKLHQCKFFFVRKTNGGLREQLICALLISSNHSLLQILKTAFQAKDSTKSSETHFKLGGGEREAEASRGRQGKEDCIGFECLGPSCK